MQLEQYTDCQPIISRIPELVDKWHEKQPDDIRYHLGGSLIGRECSRELWYSFRWATPRRFSGRLLRLFRRGQNEEATIVADLRAIGLNVVDIDQSTGKQLRMVSPNPHFSGSLDGLVDGVPEAPKTRHLLEAKTHKNSSFMALKKKGVQLSKPEHYAQMQIYMLHCKLTRALYVAINKDTDEYYMERIRLDAPFAKTLQEKADNIIFSSSPPIKLSEDPTFWKCKMCDQKPICHEKELPSMSCRTCIFSEPQQEGGWLCKHHKQVIPQKHEHEGCRFHLYMPELVPAKHVDASEADHWIKYEHDGIEFFNSLEKGRNKYPSSEMADVDVRLLGDANIEGIREQLGGTIV